MRRWAARMLIVLALAAGGCAFGPRNLVPTHHRYNESMQRAAAEELLLNVVRMRYNETLMRLDVGGIAAQFELGATAEARPFFSTEGVNLVPPDGPFGTYSRILPFLGASVTDRPTFSFSPLDDSEAIKPLFVPITADGMVFLWQSGWPVATVLRLFVDAANGLPNAPTAASPSRGAVSEFEQFRRVADLIQSLHDAGQIKFVRSDSAREIGSPLAESAMSAGAMVEAARDGFEYRQRPDRSWILTKSERRSELQIDPAHAASPEVLELCQLLHLEPGRPRYELVTGTDSFAVSRSGPLLTQIHLAARSTIQASFYLSKGVEVPCSHVEAGLVDPTRQPITDDLIRVKSSAEKRRPACASVVVRYRDHWFYIDDRDGTSKATFALMSVMVRINPLSPRKGGPALTLPVGR